MCRFLKELSSAFARLNLSTYASSCNLCRRRKLRCNREQPCSNCLRSRNGTCVYDTHTSAPPLRRPVVQHASAPTNTDLHELEKRTHITDRFSRQNSPATVQSPTNASTTTTSTSSSLLKESAPTQIADRPSQSLRITSKATVRTKPKATQEVPSYTAESIEVSNSNWAGTFHVQHETRESGKRLALRSSILHKTRLFGQSHWFNGTSSVSANVVAGI